MLRSVAAAEHAENVVATSSRDSFCMNREATILTLGAASNTARTKVHLLDY